MEYFSFKRRAIVFFTVSREHMAVAVFSLKSLVCFLVEAYLAHLVRCNTVSFLGAWVRRCILEEGTGLGCLQSRPTN